MAKLNKIITIACLLVCVFIGNGSATTDLDADRDGKVDLIYIPDLSSIYQTIMGDDDNYLTDAQLAALLAIDTWAEIEAGIALQNISGAVTDDQVPNDITISETDPVVGIINGIVKANGAGVISAAIAGTDYLAPDGSGASLTAIDGENITDNTIDDDSIDFGYGPDQVSAADIVIEDVDDNFTATEVETALDELYDTKEPSQTPAGQAEMEAGTETAIRSMSPLRVAQAIAAQVDTSARTVTVHGSVSSGTETFSPGVHTITVAGAFTWVFDNWPASGTKGVVEVDITNGGAATIMGWSSILWEGGIEPTLQVSGLDTLIFRSLDGGATISGYVAGEDMK